MNSKCYGLCLVVLCLLSSCASYNKEFACSTVPDIGCAPTEFVFEKYEGKMVDYRRFTETTESRGKGNKKQGKKNVRRNQSTVVSAPVSSGFHYVKPGDPMLTKPTNIRILFLPWEDDDKDLHAGGYVYVRMGEPEWLIVKDAKN